jgi:dTDP-4-dehydrorhamnose reductase
MGFTDVFFCPLLANDLGAVFLKMLHKKLSGLYHVVSRECLSKYDFGVRLAQQFGLDSSLISPTSVEQGGLTAARSPRLTLRVDRLAEALGEKPPDIAAGMQRFFDLYQQGYSGWLRGMTGASASTERG